MSKTQLKVTFVNPNESQKAVVTALAALFASCLYNQMKSDNYTNENMVMDTTGQKCS